MTLAGATYFLFLSAVFLVFRFYGEQRPWLAAALYLPRFPFAVPAPILAAAAARTRQWRSLVVVGAAFGIAVVPIMGLELSIPRRMPERDSIRVLSYNTDLGHRGSDLMQREVLDARPDIVLFQMTGHRTTDYFDAHPLNGYTVNRTGEFWVASRFPIVDVFTPPKLPDEPGMSANFVRYTISSPLGLLDVYSVHPESPRRGFEALRGRGFLAEPASGRMRVPEWGKLETNIQIRERQVRAVSEHARVARNPVIIAGDTNLPGLSPMFATYLGSYQDGFARVGRGFGYTYPANKPFAWMRLDRILAGPELRFVRFEVGRRRASTHYCVVADLCRSDTARR